MVTAFQLKERNVPEKEEALLTHLLANENPEIRREAAEDFLALASKSEALSEKTIDFLLDTWQQEPCASIQEPLLSTIRRITLKEKEVSTIIKKVETISDKVLEIAKNSNAEPTLRQSVWELLILLEAPKITETAFELLRREEEQNFVLELVHREIKRYAMENHFDARKRLYDILEKAERGTQAYKRALALLQEIRAPRPIDKLMHTSQ
ncbi:MAG: hypothetical protein V1915_00600 [Candidatus Bathyarchaeota archaeon]